MDYKNVYNPGIKNKNDFTIVRLVFKIFMTDIIVQQYDT